MSVCRSRSNRTTTRRTSGRKNVSKVIGTMDVRTDARTNGTGRQVAV